MDLSKLCAYPVFVTWKEQLIRLKPFDLRAITWSERFFFKDGMNGFDRMNQILTQPGDQNLFANTVLDIVYYLGSEDFQSLGIDTANEFKNQVNQRHDASDNLEYAIDAAIDFRDLYVNEPVKLAILENEIERAIELKNSLPSLTTSEILEEYKKGIEETIRNSFTPQKREREFKGGEVFNTLMAQRKKETEQKTTNWEQIYMSFFMLGGISIDDFYSLTMRQIDALHPEINFKSSEDFKLNAMIHGIPSSKLNGLAKRKPKEMEFTDEDIEGFHKAHQKLVEERRIN